MPMFEFHGRKFPYLVTKGWWRFVNFDISNMNLTSLDGLPRCMQVEYDFNCSNNFLTSLAGMPDDLEVGGNFNCSNNLLVDFNELPTYFKICGSFYCTSNPLCELLGSGLSTLPENILAGRTIRKVF